MAGLFICLPILIIYELIAKLKIIPKTAIIATYTSGVVIKFGFKSLSFAVSMISYPTIVKNKTIMSPHMGSARPCPWG